MRLRWPSLKYAWLPWLMIAMAVIVSSVGAFGFHYMENRLIMSKGEGLALAAAEIADKLDWLISERYNDARVIAHSQILQTVDGAAVKSEYIEALRKTYAPIYLWIGVTDARGRITAAGSFTGTHDMSRSPWFRAVRESGKVHVSDVEPFEEAGGTDAFSFTAPIKDRQDKFLGTVTTRVGLPVLEEVLVRTIRAFQAREGLAGAIEYQFLNDRGDAFIDSDLLHKGNVNLKRIGLPSALMSESGQPGYVEETHLRRHVPVITGYAQTHGFGAPTNVKWTILLRVDRTDLLLPIRKVLWKLVAAGALIGAPMFVALVWSTGRLRKEWRLARQEHARAAEAESKYSALLESTGEGIYGLDKEGRLTFINKAGAAALGFSPRELLGRPMHTIHHHSRADGSPYSGQDCPIYQAFQGNYGCRVDTEVFWRRDGTSFPVEYASYPLFDEGGSTVGAVVTFTDITERKEIEQTLQTSENRFRTLISFAPVGIYFTDSQGNCLLVNERWTELAGLSPEEAKGRGWIQALHPEDRERVLQEWYDTAQVGREFHSEYRFQTRNGTVHWLVGLALTLRDSKGMVTGYIGSVTDITERKLVEEALRAVLKEREQLMEDLHDGIIQSLYAIGMSIEECRRLVEEDPSKARLKLRQEIADVNAVIRAVRSHLVQGEEDMPFSAGQLKTELTRVAGTMERANALHFRLKVDSRAAERLTPEERREILYIAQEAMSNCLRHSGASIANVSLRLAQDRVCLEVEDDGMGFDKKTLHETNGGLRNIEQRAAKLGAKVEIVSHRDNGTRIHMDVPIQTWS